MLKSLFTLSMSYFLINSFSFAEVEKKGIDTGEDNSSQIELNSKLDHEKLNELYLIYQGELAKNINSPKNLYNLAVVEMKQGQLGWALAHTEASLYNAPLFNQAKSLRKEIIEQIIDKQREPPSEQVSFLTRTLDYLPDLLTSLLISASLLCFLIFSSMFYKKAYIDIIDFKREKKIMLTSLALFIVLSPLFFLKLKNFNQRWMCVVSKEARLLSGPSDQHRFIKNLKEGNCIRVENNRKDWTAISTSGGEKGWMSTNDLHLARGRKLTVNASKQ